VILPGLTDVDAMSFQFDSREGSGLLYLGAFGGAEAQDIVLYKAGGEGEPIDFDNPIRIPTSNASVPIGRAVAMAMNPLGNLFVLDASTGWVLALKDKDGDGVVEADDPLRFNAVAGERDFYLMGMAFNSSGILFALNPNLDTPADGEILVYQGDKSNVQLSSVPPRETPFARLPLSYTPANGITFDARNRENGLVFVSCPVSDPVKGTGSIRAYWDLDHDLVADDPEGKELVSGLDQPSGIATKPFDPDETDTDGDGVDDYMDNCRTVQNPSQADSNNNGIGDRCEPPECGVVYGSDALNANGLAFVSLLHYLLPAPYLLWLLRRARKERRNGHAR
jgi:hypothetical protein